MNCQGVTHTPIFLIPDILSRMTRSIRLTPSAQQGRIDFLDEAEGEGESWSEEQVGERKF